MDMDSKELRKEFYFLRWSERFGIIQRELVQRYRVQQVAVIMGVLVFYRFEDKDSDKVRDGVSLGANIAGQGYV